MPSVSRRQQKAMFAAAEGKSTLGIPKKVGKEFAAADIARGPAKLPARAPAPKNSGTAPAPMVPRKPAAVASKVRKVAVAPMMHPGVEDLPRMHTSKHH